MPFTSVMVRYKNNAVLPFFIGRECIFMGGKEELEDVKS